MMVQVVLLTKSMIEGDLQNRYLPIGIWMEDLAFDDDVIDANGD